jgi:hypothetical protein
MKGALGIGGDGGALGDFGLRGSPCWQRFRALWAGRPVRRQHRHKSVRILASSKPDEAHDAEHLAHHQHTESTQ